MFPAPCSPMKGAGSSQPGNCSAFLPHFSSLSPALPCYMTAPCSTPVYRALLLLEEDEGERLGFPMGFHPPVPLPWPEPLWVSRIPSHLSKRVPMAHGTVLHAGPPQTTGLTAGEPTSRQESLGKSPLLGSKPGCSPT